MSKEKMNKDARFDIDLSQFNVQIDNTTRHCIRELPSIDIINSFLKSKVEMKNCSAAQFSVFIEYEIKYFEDDKDFHPSGLQKTESEYYILTTQHGFICYKTEILKWIYTNKEKFGIKCEEGYDIDYVNGKRINIPRGMIIPFSRLHELQIKFENSDYLRKKIFQRLPKYKK